MKKILTLLMLLGSIQVYAQIVVETDTITVGNTSGAGGVSVFGKAYLKNIAFGTSHDSVLVRNANGSIRMVPRSSFGSGGSSAYLPLAGGNVTGTLSNTGITQWASGNRFILTVDETTARFRYNTNADIQNLLGISGGPFLPLSAGNGKQLSDMLWANYGIHIPNLSSGNAVSPLYETLIRYGHSSGYYSGIEGGNSYNSTLGTFLRFYINANAGGRINAYTIDGSGNNTWTGNGTFEGRTRVYGGGIADLSSGGNNTGIAFGASAVYSTDGTGTATQKDLGSTSLPWGSAFLGGRVGIGNTASNARLEVTQTTGEVFRADAASGALRIVADQTGVTFGGTANFGGDVSLVNKGLFFAGSAAYVAGNSIRRESNNFILSAGSTGFYINRHDNSSSDFHINSAGNTFIYGTLSGTSATFSGNVTGANLNISNWNTAYGWGNHASAGYLTSGSLSSYLALSGGTLSGALGGTSASFSGNITAGGDITANSDARLKKDIRPLGNISEQLRRLNAVSYRMKADNGAHIGFVAQEVEREFPLLVRKADDAQGTLSVNYQAMTAPLLKGWQEHDATIRQQAEKIRTQEDRIAQLERELTELKNLVKQAIK